MHTINPLRIDTCAFVFIDHQPWVASPFGASMAAQYQGAQGVTR